MPRILVIEDMPESAEIAVQILRKYGHDVWVAADGTTGLSLAQELFPDLIICDYWLPDLDARSLVRQLRKNKQLKDTKVVVCTAAPEETMQQSRDVRFDGYIAKPYRLSSFMQAIEGLLPAEDQPVSNQPI